MYVRLAFAVAAYLDPEVLLVDEVLALGMRVSEEMFGQDRRYSGEGRTVLFVSHNMNSVERLCRSVILLNAGKLVISSDRVSEVVKSYWWGPRRSRCWFMDF